MTAAPRLLSVRLQGFKSFAERTHVAFGPGISAVVGPNGSGKSNLADALRWALGEQGRALRTRKSEDVIWAGSERRPALGMADVQLVLDNRDGLLPVEFGTVELGRRLFRSGENEYVLNRQRVRLLDLVDLLDAAHLADNAFLFIGQGMVDQALALRPEERRPLFEEVAGVRRHERRRRRAEEQLVESEANLARVEDIAGELRPQVRRLAAQAQQQASRRDAGDELAEALLSAAHTRWRLAATRLDVADARLRESRSRLAAATAELVACESAAAALAEQLSEDATTTEVARRRLDEARDALAAARLEAARHESAVEAVARDEARLETERQHLEAQLVTDRRAAAIAVPIGDSSLEHELRGAEAALADALRAVAEMRASAVAIEADRETVRRAAAAQASDLDLARRREAELERVAAEESHRADVAGAARDAAMAMHVHADTARTRAVDAENAARTEAARIAGDVAGLVSEGQAAMATYAQAAARRASVAGRLDAVRDAITSRERDGLGAAARAAGGRRIDDGLVIDAGLRAAVGTALGELAGAFVVGVEHVDALATERGWVVVANEARPPAAPASEAGAESSEPAAATGSDTAARNQAAADRRMAETVAGARGGLLVEAIRSDRTGAGSMLLARAAWLPDLAACVALQPDVAAGWLLVPRDGSAVVRGPALGLGRGGEILDRRAEAESLAADVSRLDVALREADRGRSKAEEAVASATQALRDARERLTAATDLRRVAEAAEATAGRRAETTGREAAWLEAQSRRAGEARDRARATLAALAAGAGESRGAAARSPAGDVAAVGPASRTDHLAALEARVADVRATRDRLELAWRLADDTRREGERERARAEAAIGIAERRLGEIERIVATLADQAIVADRRIAAAREALASAAMTVDAATAGLDSILGRDAEERQALAGAERAVAAAREILRQLQDGGRGAEREELEARLAIEALREQLLVELAGLGQLGLRHLRLGDGAAERAGEDVASSAEAVSGADVDSNVEDASDVARLEAALAIVAADWARFDPPAEPPTPARLATLRRRFHELGAANPYALEEHAELAARLDALETQRADLTIAVERTRTLISELDGLIATQFRATFTALERAFDARFQQLFGGGFARLALTEPGDLTATGVEITARPPGKKPQALAMLSGGERALTAVALLFAMLEVRPVPFCVLDEVDAALDEANVGRFTDALRDLAGRTQFIVITHNRGTIETADALYGVTVGDDSVSRVISLRLEEATALAASDREAVPAARRAPIIPAGLTDAEVEAEVPADVPEAAG